MKVKPLWTNHFGQRPLYSTIDTIVLHTMYHPEDNDYFCPHKCQKWLDYCEVSTHYMIDRQGCIWQTVLEKDMAWHAGNSQMPFPYDSREHVNQFSLGVEILATETSGIEAIQYESLAWLVVDILKRRDIASVVGHNEIAPGRKTDPWGFEKERLKMLLPPLGNPSLMCSEMVVNI